MEKEANVLGNKSDAGKKLAAYVQIMRDAGVVE